MGAGLKHYLDAVDLGAAIDIGVKLGAKIYGGKLDARIYGAKLSARIYDVELPAKSPPRLRRSQDLGASNNGTEKCKLRAKGLDFEIIPLGAYL